MRPITVYGVKNDEANSIHEVTIKFNKEGVLNALNDALDQRFNDDEFITIRFYPTKKRAEAEQTYAQQNKG